MNKHITEETIEFNNHYINAQGSCKPHLANQLTISIANEVKLNPKIERLNFIHRNPLPVQQFYAETFNIIADSKKQFEDMLHESMIESITFTYPSDKGQWLTHQVWSRQLTD